jgi:ATP phosphoribosyltransferase regulatory subunit
VDIILELSGEAIRSRLCTFTDPNGREHCLRPDLTTPIAQRVAMGDLAIGRYHAQGQVYRLPRRGSKDPVEHQQIGFEWFGASGSPEEDAEAVAVALEAAHDAGAAGASVRFGDVAIYHAVIDALPFSPQWRDRLRRAFSRRKGPRELLDGVTRGHTGVPALASSIGVLPETDAIFAVEQMLNDLGLEPVGRSPADIADRLRDKAGDHAPDTASSAALVHYLGLTAPVGRSFAALDNFARDEGLKLGPALDAYQRRMEKLSTLNPPSWSNATFSATAGQSFEYYDGFVFELSSEADRPIVSGGRYDGLISRLSGGKRKASAIGAALRVDRLGGQGT